MDLSSKAHTYVKVKQQAAPTEGEGDPMRIGELSKLTDTPARSLRYYEEQGLIEPTRLGNGYRDYDDHLADRVIQIRGLLDTGLPTRIIRQILPCLDKPRTIHFRDATPQMLSTLQYERDQMTRRIEILVRNRDAIDTYLSEVTALAGDPRAHA